MVAGAAGLPAFAEVDVSLRDTSLEVGVTELVIDLLRVVVVTSLPRENPYSKLISLFRCDSSVSLC